MTATRQGVDKIELGQGAATALAEEGMTALERMLPLHARYVPLGPAPEPDGARLVWRLRAWEMACVTEREGQEIWLWLYANGVGEQREVSWGHEITVWRYGEPAPGDRVHARGVPAKTPAAVRGRTDLGALAGESAGCAAPLLCVL